MTAVRVRCAPGLLILLLAACAAPVRPGPEALVGVPDSDDEIGRMLQFARDSFDRGDACEAVRVAESVLAEDEANIHAHRLRQDVLRERGRRGLLLHEAQQRLRREPDSPAAHYLRGRLEDTGAEQQPHFERALALEPRFFWGWIGLGWSLRRSDPQRALSIYRRLHELAPGNRIAATNLAALLLELGHGSEAARIYSAIRSMAGGQATADLGIARVHVQHDARALAWGPLLSALRARPFDGGVRALLEGFLHVGLGVDRLEQLRDALYEDPDRLLAFLEAGGRRVLGEAFVRLGMPHAAREVLTENGGPPHDHRARRAWRRAVLACGDVATWLADLRRWFPAELLADERNQLRGRWVALLNGAGEPDPLGDPERAHALVAGLRDAGLLEEADVIATQALARADRSDLRELRDEVRRLLAFEAGVRRVLYAGYALSEPKSLRATLEEMRRVSIEILGEDVVGQPRIFSIPLVGDLVDPFGPGLPQHFARCNKHLILGQRRGLAPEAMLLTRLSLRDVEDDPDVPVPVRAREIVGDDKSIVARTTLVGGDIAGVALIDNFVVDMDAVREWASSLLRMRRIAREDGGALLRDPLPSGVPSIEPLDAEWRLALLAPVADDDLPAAVLDIIRWHERAHLSDTFYFLPPEANLWRVLGLLLRNNLRATAVEADLEARAELAALAKSPHTELVLAHIASFCGQDFASFSAHASGFERLARALQRRLVADGLDEARVAVSRWHELDPARVRRAALALLRQLW